ncbi:MAG: hypothetical protein ACREMZ_11200 [Gemmatimonadales bacterium]
MDVRNLAIEAAHGLQSPVGALAVALTYGETRADLRRITRDFLRAYTELAPRLLRSEARQLRMELGV